MDEATKLNDEILKSNPTLRPCVWSHRGQILVHAKGHPADAIAPLQTALKDEPTARWRTTISASPLVRQDILAEQRSEWHEAVRIAPGFVEAERALALSAASTGDAVELKGAADAMISAQPRSPEGYDLRSAAEGAKGT